MRADGDVFVHGEAGEGLYDLERAYDATSRQKMRWHAGNVRPPVKNAAFARARKPLIMANSVVLPAPLGPISAVIRPTSTASETFSTASKPPNALQTRSTRSSGSATGALR